MKGSIFFLGLFFCKRILYLARFGPFLNLDRDYLSVVKISKDKWSKGPSNYALENAGIKIGSTYTSFTYLSC